MGERKVWAGATAFVLSFCLGFGGVACAVTGLALRVELGTLAGGCALIGALVCILLSLPKSGWSVPAVLGCLLLLLWRSEPFRESWRGMLQSVFLYYEMAYSFPVPGLLAGPPVQSHLGALLSLYCMICMVTVWLLLRRYPIAMGVFLSSLPVVACCVVTDTVPAVWCILLWLFGLVTVIMTHAVRLRDRDEGLKLTWLLTLPVAAALGALVLAVPQKGYAPLRLQWDIQGLWDRVGQWAPPFLDVDPEGGLAISFGGELADRVDLSALGPRALRTTPVMDLEATFSGPLYLRGRDHDVYDGVSWSASTGRVEQGLALPAQWRTYRGTVELTQRSQREHLYIPCHPPVSPVVTDGMVRNEDGTTRQIFDCFAPVEQWPQLWRQQEWTGAPVSGAWLELPEDTLAAAEQILSQWSVGQGDPVSVAQRIGTLVAASAEYDLQAPRMPREHEDLAIWFLTEADRGYCVHFATAATVLLRAAGIPARYVEGYLVQCREGRSTVVRESQAHAWTEYHVEGLGWMILDATPGSTDSPTEPAQTTAPAEPTAPTEPEDPRPTQASAPTQAGPVETTPLSAPAAPASGAWLGLLKGVLAVVLALGGLVALAEGQRYVRRRRIGDRMYRGDEQKQARARYREYVRLSRIAGVPVDRALRELGEKLFFSQHRISPEELAMLDGALTARIQDMKQAGLLRRLYLRLIRAAY